MWLKPQFLFLTVLFFAIGCVTTAPQIPDFKSGSACTIVTDLDDTLKITNVERKVRMLYNAVFRSRSFLGSNELMRAMTRGNNPLIILTGSTEGIRPGVEHFFETNDYPKPDLILLRNSMGEDVKEYKLARMRALLPHIQGCLVLIGDDTQADPDVYAELQNDKSIASRIKSVYIHTITGRAQLPNQFGFATPFDIAFYESQAGRLASKDAVAVGNDILNHWDKKLIFPAFKICPLKKLLPVKTSDGELYAVHTKLAEKISETCKAPQYDHY